MYAFRFENFFAYFLQSDYSIVDMHTGQFHRREMGNRQEISFRQVTNWEG